MLTDLIPQRARIYSILLASGVAIIAALGLLYALSLGWAEQFGTTDPPGHRRIAAFDLDGEASLAAWLSTTLLFLSFQTSLLLWYLRKQTPGGPAWEPRLWVLAACMWLLMSVDEHGSLHEGFKELAARVFGTRIFGDGSIYWAAPYAVLLVGLGLPIVYGMRDCSWAAFAFLAAGASYATAVACQLEFLLPGGHPWEIIVEEWCEMLGDLLLLVSLGRYATYVAHEESATARPHVPLLRKPHLRVVGLGDRAETTPPAALPHPERRSGR